MIKMVYGISLLLILIFILFSPVSAQTASHNPIIITTKIPPPAWALAERALLKENARFVTIFSDKYVNPNNGYLECVETWGGADGPDDAMENFYNWPLLYVLGAPQSTLDIFNHAWEGHIKQYSQLGMLYREFITSFDWEHNGEQYESFLMLPLCDPENLETQHRIIRFADFYSGRDEEVTNYDPVHKIIPSLHNGSKGPRLTASIDDWGGHDYWWQTGDWTRVKGDVPMNLCATSLAVNAYLLTGDDHYKNWVLEYMDAWRERTVANNGIVPSNIGLNGITGEHWNGKWYGGLMGWNWSFGGFGVLGRGVRIGFGNAYFLSGDQKFLDILRKTGKILFENRIQTTQGLLFPNRFGDDGWYDPSASPLFGSLYADIYAWSLEDEDLDMLYNAHDLKGMRATGKYEEGNEIAWIEFLKGKNPQFPLQTLNASFERIRSGIEGLRKDTSTPDTRRSDGPQRYSRAATSALVNLTMGGIQPLWAGGLLYCQLRYFDSALQRPGLPPGIGALIDSIEKDKLTVIIVNTSQLHSRDILIQGGAYGEHNIKYVSINNKKTLIDKKYFTVRLAPGSGSKLTIFMDRFSNKPTLAFPWHGEQVPLYDD